jgi:hypothetical protein
MTITDHVVKNIRKRLIKFQLSCTTRIGIFFVVFRSIFEKLNIPHKNFKGDLDKKLNMILLELFDQ